MLAHRINLKMSEFLLVPDALRVKSDKKDRKPDARVTVVVSGPPNNIRGREPGYKQPEVWYDLLIQTERMHITI
jgi:hypothetical protein